MKHKLQFEMNRGEKINLVSTEDNTFDYELIISGPHRGVRAFVQFLAEINYLPLNIIDYNSASEPVKRSTIVNIDFEQFNKNQNGIIQFTKNYHSDDPIYIVRIKTKMPYHHKLVDSAKGVLNLNISASLEGITPGKATRKMTQVNNSKYYDENKVVKDFTRSIFPFFIPETLSGTNRNNPLFDLYYRLNKEQPIYHSNNHLDQIYIHKFELMNVNIDWNESTKKGARNYLESLKQVYDPIKFWRCIPGDDYSGTNKADKTILDPYRTMIISHDFGCISEYINQQLLKRVCKYAPHVDDQLEFCEIAIIKYHPLPRMYSYFLLNFISTNASFKDIPYSCIAKGLNFCPKYFYVPKEHIKNTSFKAYFGVLFSNYFEEFMRELGLNLVYLWKMGKLPNYR